MKINSIFRSVEGEVNKFCQGRMSTFIRLQGCNLDCSYCDTPQAREYDDGADMDIEDVMSMVKKMGCRKVTITGGEPMMQASEVFRLTRMLFANRNIVSIETNGSLMPVGYEIGSWVMDYKLDSSGMSEYMDIGAFSALTGRDFIKFVVVSEADFMQALEIKKHLQKREKVLAHFAFSPADAQLSERNRLGAQGIYRLMEEHEVFDGILNVQLHKLLGLP